MKPINSITIHYAVLKRGIMGIYHWWSEKHMNRFQGYFDGRDNNFPLDTLDQVAEMVSGKLGKRLKWADLIACRGCWNHISSSGSNRGSKSFTDRGLCL